MNDAYSPHTLEHIQTDDPAPWMGRAGVDCPAYNRQTQAAFWRGGPAWAIEDVQPTPTGRTVLSAREFLDRFTNTEYAAVRASTDVNLQRAYDNLIAADFVDLTDPAVGMGLDLMSSLGVIDASRKAELLQPEVGS
ncbi:MAG TPA: hypothetical protein VF285_03040 [Castellaniella sp.]|uniref:hypothetical protein n=1 Tax=Castellaniella sp. TaxID=1955812 RepID=UPI002EF43949